MPLKRQGSVALYVQIAEQLVREIAAGKFAPAGRLPSEAELVASYNVSRVTVRQAIDQLSQQGLVTRKQGKGTFVTGPAVQHELGGREGFYDALLRQGITPQTRLLEFGPAVPSPQIEAIFGAGVEVHLLKRLYLIKGHPIAIAYGHLRLDRPDVSFEAAERYPIYGLLDHFTTIRVDRVDVRIRAEHATRVIARELALPQRSSTLVMERLSHSSHGEVCEHTLFHILPEHYEFKLSVSGPLPISTSLFNTTAPTKAPAKRKSRRQV